jgi:CrcB protein
VSTVVLWAAVAGIGGCGAFLRFRLDGFVQVVRAGEFPVGTLAVNLSGSFTLGLLTGLSVTGDSLLLAGTALLGSFTTFSTWMLETERLAEEGDEKLAAANIVFSLAGGLLAAGGGWILGAML